MSYPKSLSYKLNKLGSSLFQKQTLKIIPDEQKIIPGGTNEFILPPNSLVDLRTFNIFMTGNTAIIKTNDENNNQYVYFLRNTGSLIESLSMTVNNYMVEYIENYNQVFNIYKDWTNASADTLKNDFLSLPDPSKFETMDLNGDITEIVSGSVKTNADKTQFHRNRPLCIKEFLGFLGSSASSFVDTNLTGEIRIKIRWAPIDVLFRNGDTANGTNVVNTPPTYTLTNMYATISKVMMDNTYYDLMS